MKLYWEGISSSTSDSISSDSIIRVTSVWGGSDYKDNHYCDSKTTIADSCEDICLMKKEILEQISSMRYKKWVNIPAEQRRNIKSFEERLARELQAENDKTSFVKECLSHLLLDNVLSNSRIYFDNYVETYYQNRSVVMNCDLYDNIDSFLYYLENKKFSIDRENKASAERQAKADAIYTSRINSGAIAQINGVDYYMKNKVLAVPKWALPHLIGRGGERIKEAQKKVGFFKVIDNNDGSSEPRKVSAKYTI